MLTPFRNSITGCTVYADEFDGLKPEHIAL
jgi:hypothetical protein